MALKTIAHALFSWTEDGKARMAMHGDIVDIADDIVAEYEKFGVFAAPVDLDRTEGYSDVSTPVEAVPEPVTEPHAPAIDYPGRPKNTAPEQDWTNYAVALYKATNGVLGLDAGAAAQLDRERLIAALAEQGA